jgi:hypothetical protein
MMNKKYSLDLHGETTMCFTDLGKYLGRYLRVGHLSRLEQSRLQKIIIPTKILTIILTATIPILIPTPTIPTPIIPTLIPTPTIPTPTIPTLILTPTILTSCVNCGYLKKTKLGTKF